MKRGTDRKTLLRDETYMQRLQCSVGNISIENCYNYVKHTKSYWMPAFEMQDLRSSQFLAPFQIKKRIN